MTIGAVDPLSYLARFDRLEGALVGGGELSGARINRLLDSINWPADQRSIDAGVETLQSTNLSANTLTEAYLTADSEGGELFADGSGNLVFWDRATVDAQTERPVQFTVSDRAKQPPGTTPIPDGTTWTEYRCKGIKATN